MSKMFVEILEFFAILSVMFLAISFLSYIIMRKTSLDKWLLKIQKKGRGLGNISASLVGALTPFCVCTTIPIFTGMLQMGVNTNMAVSFLFSSPLVNVSVVVLMFFLFGMKFALYFTAATLVFSTLGGLLVYYLRLDNEVNVEKQDALSDNSKPLHKDAATFATNLFKNVFIALVIGAVFAGLIHNYVPIKAVEYFNGLPILIAIPLVALLGFPLYLNILALAPICFTLVYKGMNPAAVMTFMVSGAGISLPTAIVLAKILKKNLFVYYLVYTFIACCLIGFIFAILS